MKLATLTLSAFLLMSTSLSAATITVDKTKLYDTAAAEKEFKKTDSIDIKMDKLRRTMEAAADNHNLVETVRARYESRVSLDEGIEELNLQKAILKHNDECNVGILSNYFHDAENVWFTMIDEAMQKEKDTAAQYIVDENSAFIPDEEMKTIYDTNRWEIGYEALVDLYTNQDKKGKVKKYFPLWSDQKFLYDVYWARKYGDIREYYRSLCTDTTDSGSMACTAITGLLETGPVLKNENNKYLRTAEARKDVEDAHKKYLAALGSLPRGASYQGVPLNFDTPEMPPVPLPPFKENMSVVDWTYALDPNQPNVSKAKLSIHPKVPDPWRELLELQYPSQYKATAEKYAPYAFNDSANSELLQVVYRPVFADYVGSSPLYGGAANYLGIGKNPIKRVVQLQFNSDPLPFLLNRVSKAMDIRSMVEYLGANYGENGIWTKTDANGHQTLLDELTGVGLMVKDFNPSNTAEVDQLKAKLLAQRDEYIKFAEKILPQLKADLKKATSRKGAGKRESLQKDIEKYETLLAALKKDKEATISLQAETASNIDEKLRETNANNALLAAQKAEAERIRKENRPKDICPIN